MIGTDPEIELVGEVLRGVSEVMLMGPMYGRLKWDLALGTIVTVPPSKGLRPLPKQVGSSTQHVCWPHGRMVCVAYQMPWARPKVPVDVEPLTNINPLL